MIDAKPFLASCPLVLHKPRYTVKNNKASQRRPALCQLNQTQWNLHRALPIKPLIRITGGEWPRKGWHQNLAVCLPLSLLPLTCWARLLKAQRCVSAATVHCPIEWNKIKTALPGLSVWDPYGRGAASICIHQVTESRAAAIIVHLLLHNNHNL